MLIITGSFRLPLDKIDAMREPMRKAILATRSEDGNIAYAYAQDIVDPTLFRITEVWRDRAASDRHLKQPHLGEFLGSMMRAGVSDLDLTQHEVASSTPLALG